MNTGKPNIIRENLFAGQLLIKTGILLLILSSSFDLFACQMLATKVPAFAEERKQAVNPLGFVYSNKTLIGSSEHSATVTILEQL